MKCYINFAVIVFSIALFSTSGCFKQSAGARKVETINGVEFAFRWCPAGTFTMGSPESEHPKLRDEIQHQVMLTKGFWMMETEVTQKQWKAIMGDNPSLFKGDDLPVEQVSWYDCKEFCRKCQQLGMPVQLPNEAQWEYACRAGTTGPFAGNLDEMAWYDINSGRKTHPVGMKKPNAWGLYDMHGNVTEWCQDYWDLYPSGSATDPTGPSTGVLRVQRGGSWSCFADFCRSAKRFYFAPIGTFHSMGFRVVQDQSVEQPQTSEDTETLEIPADNPASPAITSNLPPNKTLEIPASPTRNIDHLPKRLPDTGKEAGERAEIGVNGNEFAFRWCPAGTFMMGAPSYESSKYNNETQHQVTLTNGFWMMETEVTVGMFKAFVNDTGYISKGGTPWGFTGRRWDHNSKYSWLNPGFSQDDRHPITCVSWDDAVAFCEWLSKKTGQNITLPTEAQWEYSCRSGTTTKHACIGNIKEMAWFYLNSSQKTHPVGTKKPNAWGLYDMHGNVSEWCEDWKADYTSESVTDPIGPSYGSKRVIRGGSWHEYPEDCRSAKRRGSDPDNRGSSLGFRCVRSITSPDN